jgi:hypothetical protein
MSKDLGEVFLLDMKEKTEKSLAAFFHVNFKFSSVMIDLMLEEQIMTHACGGDCIAVILL